MIFMIKKKKTTIRKLKQHCKFCRTEIGSPTYRFENPILDIIYLVYGTVFNFAELITLIYYFIIYIIFIYFIIYYRFCKCSRNPAQG